MAANSDVKGLENMDIEESNRARMQLQETVLPKDEWDKYLNNSSDFAAFMQLAFHVACALIAAFCVYSARNAGYVSLVILAEMALGFVSSFYFTGFHEFIHNTAFKTKSLNKLFSHIVGFLVFRGANWFWCFHWLHHRYTQDPTKDPELSGGSSDLMDPSKSVCNYLRFLTGWPFGFERIFKMMKMAVGKVEDPWVKEAGLETTVRIEAGVYAVLYVACMVAAVLDERVREVVVFYWIVPHMLGAGHLRYYQFCEHRGCETGEWDILDPWGACRTTDGNWLYKKLAWNMPYHIEHHAWPAVPFHLLPKINQRIRDNQPPFRGIMPGDKGYFGVHKEFIRRVWNGEPTSGAVVVNSEEQLEVKRLAMERIEQRCNELVSKATQQRTFTMDEVSRHNTQEDCWVVINGLVIDATSFLPVHPGGVPIIVSKAGKDASKQFAMIHPAGTIESKLPEGCIRGVLETSGADAKAASLNDDLRTGLLANA